MESAEGRAHILIIEDDAGTAEAVMEKVTYAGFSGTVRHTGAEGLVAFREHTPDLVVLDLNLPDADGVDICRAIGHESQVPVIMLTARAEEVDRVIGLETGADDYVTKPFSPKELVSRIRAILRRTSVKSERSGQRTVHRAAGIELDEARHEVTVDGRPIKLTPTEYRILLLLLQNAGHVVSRETLTESVWSYDGFSPNLLEIHIGNIRRKLEDNPRRPQRLVTIRSFGYKIDTNGS